MSAQSQPINVYTVEQVKSIARRAKLHPASITLSDIRALALHMMATGEGN